MAFNEIHIIQLMLAGRINDNNNERQVCVFCSKGHASHLCGIAKN